MEAVRLAADTISAANDRLPSAARHFESGDLGSRDPDHQAGMQALMRFTHLNLRFGPFETLKVRGLDLISDRDLRVALTSLYEDRLPALIENADIDQRLSRDRILPFMLEHFELDEDMNWLLAGDEPEARSGGATLARYREETLVRFYLRSYVDAITLMEETLARIDEVLG